MDNDILYGRLDFQKVMQTIDTFRRANRKCLTNCFFSPLALREMIGEKECLLSSVGDGLLLIGEAFHDSYYRMYYYARDLRALKDGIAEFIGVYDSRYPISCEIVGREAMVKETCRAFEENGFYLRRRLRRIVTTFKKGGDFEDAEPGDVEVEFAKFEDAEEIIALLTEQFDIYSERVPEPAEIRRRIDKSEVIIIRDEGEIVAVDCFEIVGTNFHGHYTYVRKNYRKRFYGFYLGKKIGEIFLEKGIKKSFGWRDEDNLRLMKKNADVGEISEDMVDYIMLKEFIQ